MGRTNSNKSSSSKPIRSPKKYVPPNIPHNIPPNIPHNIPQISIPKPSMFDTMKTGVSFGFGSAIAHNIVGNIFRANEANKPNEANPNKECDLIMNEYNKCVKEDLCSQPNMEHLLSMISKCKNH